MISSEALAITYGVSSAITWGAGDFSGGFASRRNNIYTVVFFSQIIGGVFLLASAILFAETIPTPGQMLIGGLGGISGMLGIFALYTGLARGRMGIVAPLSAMITALIPIIFGMFTEGLPKNSQFLGFGIAILSVWFLSYSAGNAKIQAHELYLSVAAGMGFSLFFIFIDKVSSYAVLWPLCSARFASLILLSVFIMAMRRSQIKIPDGREFLFIALIGILDAGGNVFFALASRLGRLDMSAVLASLYPAATVFLARFILKEQLSLRQWGGVATALLALVFITL
ncbi:MAG: hypothetical protein B6245_00720 [Desulfobacteraceae bacterium 4572_88]|nr:MAG: hypothetical protein B6245_00720 [Desulfobacteraceae bacterium 4572_88]